MSLIVSRFLEAVEVRKYIDYNRLYEMKPKDILLVFTELCSHYTEGARCESSVFLTAANGCMAALMSIFDKQKRPFLPGDRLEPRKVKVNIRPRTGKPVQMKGIHKVGTVLYNYPSRSWLVYFEDIVNSEGSMWAFPATKFRKVK
ncbi:MAG: hypothetical protein Q7S34_02445 [bacterium]|nr:hypothetical protein [bacterium]